MSRLDRITIDPTICHGQPVVRGTRYPVVDPLGYGAIAVGHGTIAPLGAA